LHVGLLGNKEQINISKQQEKNQHKIQYYRSARKKKGKENGGKILYILYRGAKPGAALETKVKGADSIRIAEN
jgi:hypothetical protein